MLVRRKIAFLILISCLLLTSQFTAIVTAQSDIGTKLTTLSPNGNSTYRGIMPLNFTIEWDINAYIAWVTMEISYSIDNNPAKITVDNPNIDNITTETKTVVYISNLKNGNHTLTIHAEGDYNLADLFIRAYNHSFEPLFFTVDNSSPTPQPATPTPTQTPTQTPTLTPTQTNSSISTSQNLMIFMPIVIVVFLILAVVALVIYRKKHSKVDVNK
jgi:hypothetical protein